MPIPGDAKPRVESLGKNPLSWTSTIASSRLERTGIRIGMSNSCLNCRDLWREFREATSRQIIAENKLMRALLDRDYEAVKVLQQQTEIAFDHRAKLRDAIRRHDTEAHGTMPRGF